MLKISLFTTVTFFAGCHVASANDDRMCSMIFRNTPIKSAIEQVSSECKIDDILFIRYSGGDDLELAHDRLSLLIGFACRFDRQIFMDAGLTTRLSCVYRGTLRR